MVDVRQILTCHPLSCDERNFIDCECDASALSFDFVYCVLWVQVVANATGSKAYLNFDLFYFPNPIVDILHEWVAKGGEAWQLIEPVDGFHPNQVCLNMHGIYSQSPSA